MTDTAQVLQEYLLASGNTLLTYLGGNYVSTPVAKKGWSNTHRQIIFHPETETTHITRADNATTFVFKCYGGTALFSDARAVYRQLVDYLHNARGQAVASGRIKLARLVTAFQGPPEPDTGWPVMVAKFDIATEDL